MAPNSLWSTRATVALALARLASVAEVCALTVQQEEARTDLRQDAAVTQPSDDARETQCWGAETGMAQTPAQCPLPKGYKRCRSGCCRRCSTGPGRGLRKFARWLEKGPPSVNMFVAGDSVAQMDGFFTANTFIKTMEATYPGVKWNLENGPRSTVEMYYDMMQDGSHFNLTKQDIILVHFALFGNRVSSKQSEPMIRHLLQLPQKPLVVLVHHCSLDQLKGASSFLSEGTWKTSARWSDAAAAEERSRVQALVRRYQLPIVSACSALETLLSNSCSKEKQVSGAKQLQEDFYNPDDTLHYSYVGSGMEGCLLADLMISGKEAPKDQTGGLPEALYSAAVEDGITVFSNSTLTGDLQPEEVNGWSLEKGGKGGEKRWYTANSFGAAMSFTIPPCTELRLSYYTHPQLPMGVVEVTVDGGSPVRLDACCQSGRCQGLPPTQGIHESSVVAKDVPLGPHRVEVRLVERGPGELPSVCPLPESGASSKFDIIGVTGRVHRA